MTTTTLRTFLKELEVSYPHYVHTYISNLPPAALDSPLTQEEVVELIADHEQLLRAHLSLGQDELDVQVERGLKQALAGIVGAIFG